MLLKSIITIIAISFSSLCLLSSAAVLTRSGSQNATNAVSSPLRRSSPRSTGQITSMIWPLVSIEILTGSVDHNDFSSPVDAYVKLRVRGEFIGRTIPDWDTHWPKWNKKFRVSSLALDETVEFHVFDYDMFSNDDHIGGMNITLGTILGSGKNGKQVRLKFSHGYIIVRFTVVSVPSCGVSSKGTARLSRLARIKGGRSAEEYEFPWQVSLQKWDEVNGVWSHFCGGTILNDQYIVTAAHCVASDEAINIRAYVGSSTLMIHAGPFTEEDDDEDRESDDGKKRPNSTYYTIEEVINHENYNEDNNANDLALLRTRRPIQFTVDELGNHVVNAICLPSADLPYDRKVATATGWGHSHEDTQPDRLQKVDLLILKDWSCADIYNMLELSENWHENIMLCAYGDGKDTKRGDSGGPLIIYRGGRAHLVGVTSWGLPLLIEVLFDLVDKDFTVPGGYTEIASFLPWLEENAHAFNVRHFLPPLETYAHHPTAATTATTTTTTTTEIPTF